MSTLPEIEEVCTAIVSALEMNHQPTRQGQMIHVTINGQHVVVQVHASAESKFPLLGDSRWIATPPEAAT